MALVEILGAELQRKDGTMMQTAELSAEAEYVGVYFSAHWCPPCRNFTPMLAEFFKKFAAKNAGKLQIVFVSSDRSEDDFSAYYADMPWMALPFSKRDEKAAVSKKFDVTGIPTLVLLESKTGKVICANARSAVQVDPEGEEFPWQK